MSEQDCQLVVDRSVELKMKELNKDDPQEIARAQERLRKELESEMRSCIGRRVPERTIDCVKAAQSSRELEKCVK